MWTLSLVSVRLWFTHNVRHHINVFVFRLIGRLTDWLIDGCEWVGFNSTSTQFRSLAPSLTWKAGTESTTVKESRRYINLGWLMAGWLVWVWMGGWIDWLIHWLIDWLIHSFIHSFIHLFIHSLIDWSITELQLTSDGIATLWTLMWKSVILK